MHDLDFLVATVTQAQCELFGPQRAIWLNRLEQEHHNLQAALQQLLDAGSVEQGLQLATALREFWLGCEHVDEGRNWLTAFLTLPSITTPSPIHASALDAAGALAFWQNDQAAAQALMEEGLALRRALGDKPGIALSLIHLGTNQWVFEDHYAAAQTLYEASLAIFQEIDDSLGIAYVRLNLGHLALEQGRYTVADGLLKESLVTFREQKDMWAVNFALDSLAGVAAGCDQPARALRLAGASQALRDSIGIVLPPVWKAWLEGLLEPAELALGEDSQAAMWAVGPAMTPDEAIAYALGEGEAWAKRL